MSRIVLFFVAALFAFSPPPERNIKVCLIGHSTRCGYHIKTAPLNGWGMPFNFFDSSVIIDNRARAGRGTRRIAERVVQVVKEDHVDLMNHLVNPRRQNEVP